MSELPSSVFPLLDRVAGETGKIVVLTGAGISAESGIPTFRGPEGYWRVGSKNYHPMELATFASFSKMPEEVWAWYLYRRAVCRAAEPNSAHRALVELERRYSDRFLLITQNVDGLHLRAGSSAERTYQIHGSVDLMRCSVECTPDLHAVPEGIDIEWPKGRALGEVERKLLLCGECNARSRPHVLWFDEAYDEERFRFESSIRAAAQADLLIVVGTTGSTNLPLHVGALVARRGAPIVVVNPEPNPFTDFAERVPDGHFLAGRAGQLVPPLVDELVRRAGG